MPTNIYMSTAIITLLFTSIFIILELLHQILQELIRHHPTHIKTKAFISAEEQILAQALAAGHQHQAPAKQRIRSQKCVRCAMAAANATHAMESIGMMELAAQR